MIMNSLHIPLSGPKPSVFGYNLPQFRHRTSGTLPQLQQIPAQNHIVLPWKGDV